MGLHARCMRALWKSWLNVFRGAVLIDASGLAGAFGGSEGSYTRMERSVCAQKISCLPATSKWAIPRPLLTNLHHELVLCAVVNGRIQNVVDRDPVTVAWWNGPLWKRLSSCDGPGDNDGVMTESKPQSQSIEIIHGQRKRSRGPSARRSDKPTTGRPGCPSPLHCTYSSKPHTRSQTSVRQT